MSIQFKSLDFFLKKHDVYAAAGSIFLILVDVDGGNIAVSYTHLTLPTKA